MGRSRSQLAAGCFFGPRWFQGEKKVENTQESSVKQLNFIDKQNVVIHKTLIKEKKHIPRHFQ